MSRPPVVALVGNPNTGKTTLFNALTGLKQRVGNYPGVTVEVKTGKATVGGRAFDVVDVPGCYSLSPRSPDETIAVDLLFGMQKEFPKPDAVVCVVDASNLERNLYLATQVFELGLPVVVALNMVDVAEASGLKIDADRLAAELGVPVVPIQANRRKGIDRLGDAALAAVGSPSTAPQPPFPEPFVREAFALETELHSKPTTDLPSGPFLAKRLLLDVGGELERRALAAHGAKLRDSLHGARRRLCELGDDPVGLEARVRYTWIAERVAGAVSRPAVAPRTWTDRLDAILLHRFWGVVAFALAMSLFFWSVFALAGLFQEGMEAGLGAIGKSLAAALPEGPIRSLVVDGAWAGASSVLTFLPQIVLLFGFLSILEDCGYLARAAFLMDRLLAPCGLSGKSFIPMLSSFACAVPGVMATRTIEDPRDRLATILVLPLMSCSARLPVYTLLIGAFVEGALRQTLTMIALYALGLVVAPLVAWSLRRTVLRGEPGVFLLELPPYKTPALATVLHRMFERGWAFVKRAGTLIVAASIVIWGLTYYPRPAVVDLPTAPDRTHVDRLIAEFGSEHADARAAEERYERELAAAFQRNSFLGRAGRWLEPAVEPLGWDWKIGMAALASFPAREVVLAALNTIYAVGDDEEGVELVKAMREEKRPDGRPRYDFAVALSIMVFFALCCQCVSTLIVMYRETGSWVWPTFAFVYMTVLAYVGALIAYQVAARLAGSA